MAIYPEVNTFGFPGEGFSADLGKTFTFNGTKVLLVASDNATASISLPATLLDGLNTRLTPRLVFSFFLNEGLFVRRREYLQNNNVSAIRLGSIVIASHITGGVRVSNLQDPVRTTFITNPVSGRQLLHSTIFLTSHTGSWPPTESLGTRLTLLRPPPPSFLSPGE